MPFDASKNPPVRDIHNIGPVLAQPDHKRDPANIKEPSLFCAIGNVHVSGHERGVIIFSGGPGAITREDMRLLIQRFQEWDKD